MGLLSNDVLKTLAEYQGLCISIYMPTYSAAAGTEVQQNPIRFKNLIKQAEARLGDYNMRHDDAMKLLQPALELDKEEFWQQQNEGLAIFLADGFFEYYQLPSTVDDILMVGDRFYLKPLMPVLAGNGTFYLLTLSQKQIRVMEGDRFSIREVEIEGLPKSMGEALQYDETAQDGQFRISTNKGGTNNSFQHAGSFHGQGSPDRDDIRQDLLQFFHQIDAALHPFLRDKQGPLVLTGVEYLMPIYREANTYQHLLDDSISGNTKILEPEELHTEAWAIVEPHFQQSQQAAIAHYNELSNTGRTSADLQEAVPAAFYGRVEQLFVAIGAYQWGTFDPQSNQLQLHTDEEPGDEDLLNVAAIQTILNGGTVYAVDPEQVPDTAPLAAVFRY